MTAAEVHIGILITHAPQYYVYARKNQGVNSNWTPHGHGAKEKYCSDLLLYTPADC